MRPRFVGRLGLADAVTATNAALGFVAVAAVAVDPTLTARLILLAAIADGLDGIIAKWRGGTPIGPHLDSLADVASFGIAPAMLVFVGLDDPWTAGDPLYLAAALVVPALFVTMGVVRLAFYTAYDKNDDHTQGVTTTLAATILAASVLSGVSGAVLLGATLGFSYLMVATVTYPDLYPRDAFVMGAIQALAVLVPDAFGGLFPKALLAWALAYLVLAPWFYWRSAD
ncbi:protein sorting system archaetidylserine synthase [Halobacteriaceae archaeon GCM10025711]